MLYCVIFVMPRHASFILTALEFLSEKEQFYASAAAPLQRFLLLCFCSSLSLAAFDYALIYRSKKAGFLLQMKNACSLSFLETRVFSRSIKVLSNKK